MTYKTIKILSTFGIIAASIFSLIGSPVGVSAQRIGIHPAGLDPKANGWFSFVAKPGETVSNQMILSNDHPSATKVLLATNDYSLTTTGALTFKGNEEANTSVGNWIKLDSKNIDIKGATGEKIPFKVEIPSDTKPGEYLGAITAMQNDENIDQGNVGSKLRIAAPIYITVPGDLTLKTKADNLQLINPQIQNFPKELDLRSFIKPENMVIKFNAKNLGNVFSTLEGNMDLTLPSGEVKKLPITRKMYLASVDDQQYVQTNIPYQVGLTKIKFDFTTKPTNNDKPDLKKVETDGTLEYSVNLSQGDLDTFKKVREDLDKGVTDQYGIKPEAGITDKTASAKSTSSSSSDNKKAETNNNYATVFYVLGGVVILLLIAIIVIQVRSQQSKATDEKKKDKEKKKLKIK